MYSTEQKVPDKLASIISARDAKGAKTAKSFVARLDDGREVWLNGQLVNVTQHPAFSGILDELGRLYDLQHTPQYREVMTYLSAESGNPISYSYFAPKDRQELEKKWKNSHIWMEESWGQLARLPDFMSNVVVGLYDFRKALGQANPMFEENVNHYYHYCKENDICLTHAIGDPQIDRSSSPVDNPDLALRVIEETTEGVVVRGAKQLATLAPVSDEVLVYLSPSFAMRERKEFVIWFALPMNTPGLKTLCREPQSVHTSGHKHPFASKYDEQDAMLFFDDVLVPWDRVFLLYDAPLALKGFSRLNTWSLYSSLIRFYHRVETFIGVAQMAAESIGVKQFREIQNNLGELVSYAEMVRLSLHGMMDQCYQTDGGLCAPADTSAIGIFAAQISSRMSEILRQIAASGLIMQPSEADLLSPGLKPFLEKYMGGKDQEVTSKSRLFRLAWDLTCDSYGLRQELYERWHRGDVTRNRINLLKSVDFDQVRAKITRLISQPLP